MQENTVNIIEDVKKELTGDEKVLESAFKLETYYKKYKFAIWGLASIAIVFFVGSSVMNTMHESKLEEANEAFLVLQSNAEDSTALATLKAKNPALFELYSYAEAVKKQNIEALKTLTKSSNTIIADVSAYIVGVIEKKPVSSKLYNDLALFEEGYVAILAGDNKTAKDKLGLIDERSSLAMMTKFLQHSMIKAQ